MNWKREAIDKLRNYETRKQSVENIRMELNRLQLIFSGIRSAATDGTPISGGGNTREDALLTNIVHRDELKRNLKETNMWVSTVENALAVLPDEDRRILDRFYIHGGRGAAQDLCDTMNIEQATVYRKRDEALRRFTVALYGVTESV